jgi:hypothetical protein
LKFRGLDPPPSAYPWGVDALTLFGLAAVTAMLIFYALEDRSPWYVLAFAGACALGSVYGFLQGAWPFGVIEAIWTGVAVYRWPRVGFGQTAKTRSGPSVPPSLRPAVSAQEAYSARCWLRRLAALIHGSNRLSVLFNPYRSIVTIGVTAASRLLHRRTS